MGEPPTDDGNDRALLVPLVVDGEIVGEEPLRAARERHASARAELPLEARKLSKGEPVPPRYPDRVEHVRREGAP